MQLLKGQVDPLEHAEDRLNSFSGDLGITPETRADHACYIKNWLAVLKADKKAILTAASKASEAANWLIAKESAA